ncbi:MAG: DegT/DnrJ/EryC1/StrS family aminotransferase [Bacteroidales bacterium]|nr:DegT/DnrJ/EryC1/StrS family aminotransferase [Bacteroidales bacterium]
MVDLYGQYVRLKDEIDQVIKEVIESSAFINGPAVRAFAGHLSEYTGAGYIIPCGNGTDALQAALVSLHLQPGDEVLVPDFTFIATVETVALLGLTPVIMDVNPDTFLIDPASIEKYITPKTKAIIPVHLFGQCVDMAPLLEEAEKYELKVIEDAAQALGTWYTFPDGTRKMAGTMGDIGCTSFFPSKNLGAFGDGGAVFTNDEELAGTIRSYVNHGTQKKYYHKRIGINSRLDTLQAAILDVKLNHLDEFIEARQQAAAWYDEHLGLLSFLKIPARAPNTTHTFHQYTLVTRGIDRRHLMNYLKDAGIPSMIYYPLPMHRQEAFSGFSFYNGAFPVTDQLCNTVMSLPVHTEMEEEQLDYITTNIKNYPHG